ncbi:unnamed protein product [Prunus armeniaca]|uniref:Uncharacterized protein n=1 Tax=Prunus armeniaca TaxID=36596 RepID=A0A6J5XE83_PRUAR|nr:unnamed protein product [Prunus armeniaca]
MAMAILRKFQKKLEQDQHSDPNRAHGMYTEESAIPPGPAVDLRPWMGPIRDRMTTHTVGLFAVNACVETLRTLRTGRKTTLSPESVIHRLGRVRKRTTAYRSPSSSTHMDEGDNIEVDWPDHATKTNNVR